MNNKKMITVLALSSLSLSLLTSCGSKDKKTETSSTSVSKEKKVDLNSLDLPQLNDSITVDEYLVKLTTSAGEIEVKLFPKQAPLAVENFVVHIEKGYYNGIVFHRVIKEFMIQGGDPKGDGTGGESIWKGKDGKKDSGNGFKIETSKQLYNIRGALSMANTGQPNSNGSQFFINQNNQDVSDGLLSDDYPEKIIETYRKGGSPNLDGGYTVFGQVVKGMDVVDKIANAEVKEGSKDSPANPVKIESTDILQKPKK
jgi:peptidyl-prolyl cis-trans isomerase A (cyclophilin A)